MKRIYKSISKQVYKFNNYELVPIRSEDRYDIMRWRNEQIYHLRQVEPITKEDQDSYFDNVIEKLFNQEQPDQILFSFLENGVCVGYGGLVHINWVDRNAEVSFVIDTALEINRFIELWVNYLEILKKVSFKDLNLHKIFTYAYDLRPKLFEALKISSFKEEARLKYHIYFDGDFRDVLIHSFFNPLHNLSIRKAKFSDKNILFDWVNEKEVRYNALNSEQITVDNHNEWFKRKLKNQLCKIFIFENKDKLPLGQVRIDFENDFWVIDYSVDKAYRGLGLGKMMVKRIIEANKGFKFMAIVKNCNTSSKIVFETLGFHQQDLNSNLVQYILNS